MPALSPLNHTSQGLFDSLFKFGFYSTQNLGLSQRSAFKRGLLKGCFRSGEILNLNQPVGVGAEPEIWAQTGRGAEAGPGEELLSHASEVSFGVGLVLGERRQLSRGFVGRGEGTREGTLGMMGRRQSCTWEPRAHSQKGQECH